MSYLSYLGIPLHLRQRSLVSLALYVKVGEMTVMTGRIFNCINYGMQVYFNQYKIHVISLNNIIILNTVILLSYIGTVDILFY